MDGNGNNNKYPRDFITLKSESGSEDVHYSALYEGIPEEYKLIARETLKETEDNKKEGIKTLKAFAQREKLLCTDYDIIISLRNAKYKVKKAESKLKNLMELRETVTKWLANVNEKKIGLVLDDICMGLLPYRDKHGRIIIFTRPNAHFDLYDPDDLKAVCGAFLLYICTSPLTSINGLAYIVECETDRPHVFYPIVKMYCGAIKHFFQIPIRYGRADIMNEIFLVRWAYNIVRPVLPDKLTKRVSFHGKTYEALKKVFHPDLLPEEFGGNLGPMNDKFYREELLDFILKLKAGNVNSGC